jgi:Ni,Fe-hydrogenase III large subunit
VNHIGDCAALAHDVAFDVAATDLAALREELLQLNDDSFGHRLLRGLNRPGGVILRAPLAIDKLRATVDDVRKRFFAWVERLEQWPAFRNRLQWTGILTEAQARELGATGLVARASGIRRDTRLQYPTGMYKDERVRRLVERGLRPTDVSMQAREAVAGDALARFLMRAREVASSVDIIRYILDQPELQTPEVAFVTPIDFRQAPNFEFGLGYVEGWRGDVVYWLMKDKFERIYRCKVRDPSMLNWPALKAAIEPHVLDPAYVERHRPPGARAETIIADFPIVNKSFNLSYSGNDL